jgi:hypothetical protein
MSKERELLEAALYLLEDEENWPDYEVYKALTDSIKAELAKPEEEPVAWIDVDCEYVCLEIPTGDDESYYKPLYSSPRPMQRLTDDEIGCCASDTPDWDDHEYMLSFARSIETAIIEKNNG